MSTIACSSFPSAAGDGDLHVDIHGILEASTPKPAAFSENLPTYFENVINFLENIATFLANMATLFGKLAAFLENMNTYLENITALSK